MFAFSLVGCRETVNANVENSENLDNPELGTAVLVKLGNGLWYDSTTRIVYWWNERLGANCWSASSIDTIPFPYYAPNGLPYRYNPETSTFEEIEK